MHVFYALFVGGGNFNAHTPLTDVDGLHLPVVVPFEDGARRVRAIEPEQLPCETTFF